MRSYDTLTEAISDLRKRGYDRDFNRRDAWLECMSLDKNFLPHQFHVDEVYRFEGMSNPSDNAVLYAIRADAEHKGLLVDAYGAYSGQLTPEMIAKLRIDEGTARA